MNQQADDVAGVGARGVASVIFPDLGKKQADNPVALTRPSA